MQEGHTNLEHVFYEKASDHVDNISFKQWVTTDQTTLLDNTTSPEDYLELLMEKVNQLSVCHFIAKSQSLHVN